MSLVASAAQLRDARERLTRPRFLNGRRITVEFLTSEETYRRLLPPLLEPADEPLMIAGIGRWDSNCIGTYTGGSVSLVARHAGCTGGAAVGMWMDSERAVAFGRDVLGEPKKLADASITVRGDQVTAWIERGGERILEIDAELGEDAGASSVERFSFNYRSRQAVDGFQLDGPAVLTRTSFMTDIRACRGATARLALRSTPDDALGEIEIIEIRGAQYQLHDIVAQTTAVGTVEADLYLPFHYGRLDRVGP